MKLLLLLTLAALLASCSKDPRPAHLYIVDQRLQLSDSGTIGITTTITNDGDITAQEAILFITATNPAGILLDSAQGKFSASIAPGATSTNTIIFPHLKLSECNFQYKLLWQ